MIGSPVEPVEVVVEIPLFTGVLAPPNGGWPWDFWTINWWIDSIGRKPMLRALLARYEQLLSRAPTATTGVVAAGLGVSEWWLKNDWTCISSGWWFQEAKKQLGEMIEFYHFFQMGWNHQLVMVVGISTCIPWVMLIHSVGRSFLRLVSFFCLVSSDVFEIVFSVLLDCYGLIMCCTDRKTVVSSWSSWILKVSKIPGIYPTAVHLYTIWWVFMSTQYCVLMLGTQSQSESSGNLPKTPPKLKGFPSPCFEQKRKNHLLGHQLESKNLHPAVCSP